MALQNIYVSNNRLENESRQFIELKRKLKFARFTLKLHVGGMEEGSGNENFYTRHITRQKRRWRVQRKFLHIARYTLIGKRGCLIIFQKKPLRSLYVKTLSVLMHS